ncbi:OsmC family peroxiredoxin [Demequina sediminicola]|uniref:OsmC family peroxiredoxin n=1 Tax=Demequina sediminicola TaxID=1095026 RepID=UPI0007826B74|nr:OsmC family peroxiredoxin [Demequina sediminicola]
MTVTSKATTLWRGGLADGTGTTALGSNVATLGVNWKARSEGGTDTTTPEELLAAAHASCFAMALSHELGGNDTPPNEVDVSVEIDFVAGTGVTGSRITVEAEVPGITEDDFSRIAQAAKDGCPISQALSGIDITLESATLRS